MKPIERRLRALEAKANYKPPEPPRGVIVQLGETLEGVLEREGVVLTDEPRLQVIVRVIVAPKVTESTTTQ